MTFVASNWRRKQVPRFFHHHSSKLLPVTVDHNGLDPAKLPNRASLVFVTPSHQFPTGSILPLARRFALLEWATRNNSVVVENDRDSEFSYEGRSLKSLQGLDTEGRVIYVGTFSRTVFPSLRIGYMIVPKSLIPVFSTAKWFSDQYSATLDQQTLAEFITSGLYERHLRRLRRRNRSRREALLEAINEYLGDRVEVTGADAGAHVVLWPRKQISEDTVIARAASRGVGIYGISHCFPETSLADRADSRLFHDERGTNSRGYSTVRRSTVKPAAIGGSAKQPEKGYIKNGFWTPCESSLPGDQKERSGRVNERSPLSGISWLVCRPLIYPECQM
jgi:DNA-binding transcriptional MocR family regulator